MPPPSIPAILRGLLLGLAVAAPAARGEPPAAMARPKASPAELKRLDTRLDEFRETFMRDISGLIKSYEDAGQFERSKVLLEALEKLDPQSKPVRDKLAEIKGRILDASEFEIEIEPGGPWQPVGTVAAGQPLRILVAGEYKLVAAVTVGAEGLSGDDPAEDVVPYVPLGGLMAVITAPQSGGRAGGQPPRPFAVGANYEKPAPAAGFLSVKVNVPPGARCTGRLTARISGVTRAEQP